MSYDGEIKKLFGEAYDKLYDLDSACHFSYKDLLKVLEENVEAQGYEFRLSSRDKWKCVKKKEGDI